MMPEDVDKTTLSPNANLGLSVFNAINKGVDALHIKGGYKKYYTYFLSEPLTPRNSFPSVIHF